MFAVEVKCPECGSSLMNKAVVFDNHPSIQMHVENCRRRGEIWLSSVYGSYKYEVTFHATNGALTFHCPHCQTRLQGDLDCHDCGSKMINLTLTNGGHVHFCPREGCKGHHVEYENGDEALRDAYTHYEYMRPDE